MILIRLIALLMIVLPAAGEEGWTALFDGKTLAGWASPNGGEPGKGWEVRDGAIHRMDKAGDLISSKEFGDFELEFEWKVAARVNSGFKYRVRKTALGWIGPEYQVLDDAGHPNGKQAKTSAAALYALLPPDPEKKLAPVGEWNQSRVVAVGPKIEHWLNGVLVLSATVGNEAWNEAKKASKFAKVDGYGAAGPGRILLQDHGGEVWFRSLRIRDR